MTKQLRIGRVNLDDPGFWQWMAEEYETLFQVCPEADGLVFTFSENFNGADFYDRTKIIHTGKSPEDTCAKAIETLWNVCKRHGKSLYVRNWTDRDGPDRWIRNAIQRNDPNVWMMSKATGPGDWGGIQEDYEIIGTCTGHPELIEFDVVGEYWGLTWTPWAGIKYLKHLWSEFSAPRGADGVVARVDRETPILPLGLNPRAVECPNRINMYALDVLADCPDAAVDDIYNYWCSHWFGRTAAGRVASALKRTFDITTACYGLPQAHPFPIEVAKDYCLKSLFDVDCVNTVLKSSESFLPGSGQTNYDVLRDPLMRVAARLDLTVPPTLFGDFGPSYREKTKVTCSATVVDAANGLNPKSFQVEYSTDGGVTWVKHTKFTVTASGASTDPYHVTARAIPFGSRAAPRNKVRFSAANLAGVTTSSVFSVK